MIKMDESSCQKSATPFTFANSYGLYSAGFSKSMWIFFIFDFEYFSLFFMFDSFSINLTFLLTANCTLDTQRDIDLHPKTIALLIETLITQYNNCREVIVSTLTYNKVNFTHVHVHKHRKNHQKIFKISKKKTPQNSLEKLFPECFKLLGNFPGGLYWSHFIEVTGLLSRIYILHKSHPTLYIFQGIYAVLKVSENSHKNIF